MINTDLCCKVQCRKLNSQLTASFASLFLNFVALYYMFPHLWTLRCVCQIESWLASRGRQSPWIRWQQEEHIEGHVDRIRWRGESPLLLELLFLAPCVADVIVAWLSKYRCEAFGQRLILCNHMYMHSELVQYIIFYCRYSETKPTCTSWRIFKFKISDKSAKS